MSSIILLVLVVVVCQLCQADVLRNKRQDDNQFQQCVQNHPNNVQMCKYMRCRRHHPDHPHYCKHDGSYQQFNEQQNQAFQNCQAANPSYPDGCDQSGQWSPSPQTVCQQQHPNYPGNCDVYGNFNAPVSSSVVQPVPATGSSSGMLSGLTGLFGGATNPLSGGLPTSGLTSGLPGGISFRRRR